jgi:hypothetical protein
VAIVVLGQLGLAQRTKEIARLRETPSSAPRFARRIAGEVVVMGAATASPRPARTATSLSVRRKPRRGLTNYPSRPLLMPRRG